MISQLFSTTGRRLTRRQIVLSPVVLMAVTTLFVLLVDNRTFWSTGADIFRGQTLALVGIGGAVYFLTLAVFSAFALPWVVKPFAIFILILSSVSSYYMDNLGVFIDRNMIQNVMVTTVNESKHLITLDFLLHVLIYGIVPSLVVALGIKIKKQRKLVMFGAPVAVAALSVLLTIGLLFTNYKDYSAVVRAKRDFMGSYQPGAPLVGTVRYASMVGKTLKVVAQPIGQDAVKGPSYDIRDKPSLTILVVGETARAQNFSLNGYAVDTNPELSKLPILNFDNVSSCGTATAVSLPCMFSKFGRADYTFEKGLANQNVLDVLSNADVNVEWWDNNTGDKGLAARIPTRSFSVGPDSEFCRAGECDDGVFLENLRTYAAGITKDTVLVFHQIGTHGPAYYLRYPPELEKFKPACRTSEFKKCTRQEIVNTYDNTIAYTDKVLAETIRFLQSQDDLSASLLYMSDHGESLGEGGVYLHGTPYFMAPEEQTKVPMILWMSDKFENQFNIMRDCLSGKTSSALSQDNLFHSLLGMLDIKTNEYNENLDFFASCKGQKQVSLQ